MVRGQPFGKMPAEVEAKVVRLIREGLSRSHIRARLGIAASTVGRIARDAGLTTQGRPGRPPGIRKPKRKAVMPVVREGINYAAEAANLKW